MRRTNGPAPEPLAEKARRGAEIRKPIRAVIPLEPVVLPVTADPTPGDDLVAGILAGPAARWISQPDQMGILALLREAWNERYALKAAIASVPVEEWALRGHQPAGITRLGVVEKQITEWLSQLGLTPVDRSRLGIMEVQAKSRLEDLRERRNASDRKVRVPRS